MRAVLVVCLALVACGKHSSGDDGPDGGIIIGCPNCPMFPGLGTDKPPCSGAAADPQLVYPPDQVLLPPNMNVIDVHFMPGDGNTIFEIDFENPGTDVRIETRCNAITNTRGDATGGCDFKLDPDEWNYVSGANRGGDPVKVTVRAAPEDLSCVSGSNTREVNFAEEDMKGGIYYWQSVTQGGIAGTTGGIFRKDFGDPSPSSQPFLTPGTLNKCVGCHFLSHDGTRMTYGSDDADSDDEYGDLHVGLIDVNAKTTFVTNVPAGFQAFGPTSFVASDGTGMSNSAGFTQYMSTNGVAMTPMTLATLAGKRATQPDWSRDGGKLYFTVPGTVITGLTGYNRKDDLHFTNGSIYVVDAAGGTPMALVTAANVDENNYYPSISPDGTSLVFDRAVGTTLATRDDYNNPNAKLFAMVASGGTPIEMVRANYKDGMTNSWPRWSPFVQMYKGKHILWVTFSSTRDYGLRVQNENPASGATFNCYPPVSPEDPSSDHKKPFDPHCTQPQIWMVAVSLDDLAAGSDPSFPAFWLPFQDDTAHNHIAQWVDAIQGCTGSTTGQACSATMPCCDGSTCNPTTMVCESIIF
jgi:hypothetical protein